MNKSSRTAKLLLLAAFCLLLPIAANAQSALTGVVKDTSGAVLPGVTVEAASPALIEKTRSTVTDESGGFKIVDLRPGIYSLTFSLEGFSPVKREGLELPSNFTMTVNTDLKVGALEETLTVTGHARRWSTCRARRSRRCSIARRSMRFPPAAPSRAWVS